MRIAITREVSPSIINCELTHLARQPIDVELARLQHSQYEICLSALGYKVQQLPAAAEMPDSVFVEDIAVVLDEVAVITRPGASSRRLEIPAVAAALGSYRRLIRITPNATLDGGDVLQIGRVLYVGLSGRTNLTGVKQFSRVVKPFGYTVKPVQFGGCLHLKSAVTRVAPDTLLVNPDWVDSGQFGRLNVLKVDSTEPLAANALLLEGRVIFPSSHAATSQILERAGVRVHTIDISELAKAEGGVTCCSLIFDA